jgi:hypothetical protein
MRVQVEHSGDRRVADAFQPLSVFRVAWLAQSWTCSPLPACTLPAFGNLRCKVSRTSNIRRGLLPGQHPREVCQHSEEWLSCREPRQLNATEEGELSIQVRYVMLRHANVEWPCKTSEHGIAKLDNAHAQNRCSGG